MLQRKPMAALLALAFSGLAQAQQAGSTTLDEVLRITQDQGDA